MRRRLLFIFVALLAGAVLLVATLPFWLGGALERLVRSRGITFSSYERVGYGRFALREVEYRRAGVRVTVARAEADTPVLWLWRHWRKTDRAVVAGAWRVEVEPSTQPKEPKPSRGWLPLRAQLQRIAAELDRWLPLASTGAGVVKFPGGEISLDAAKWAARELKTQGLAYRALKTHATISFPPGTDLLLVAIQTTEGAPTPLAAKLESRGAQVSGDVAVWEQRASLEATFGASGWLPAEAALHANDWNVPGDKLKLGEHYSAVRGSAKIEWRAERFTADVTAKGDPLPGKSAPPLDVALRGNGDMAAFTIESLQVALPGIAARLSEPVTVERSGKIRESAARFAFQADLAKQPWFEAKGSANGEARLVSGLAASPVVEFSVAAREVNARDIDLAAVDARGRLDWPRLHVAEATILGGEGERLSARGGYDFRAKEILDAVIDGQIRRQSIARWLPKQPEFDLIKISAKAAGGLAGVKHSGRAQADGVKTQGVNPLAVVAEWRGTGAAIEHVQAEATAGASKITLTGNVGRESAQLTALEFFQADTSRLHLTTPATLRWKPQLRLEALHLEGGEKSTLTASVVMAEAGRIEVSANEISSRWLADFVPAQGPAWQLTLFALVGAWDRGPMKFTLSAGAALEIGEGRTAAVVAAAHGDKDGIQVDALRATEGAATVVNAVGRVPITVTPASKPLVHIDPNGPLKVDATVAPNSAFWEKLAAASGIGLEEPQASAHLTGTWQRPEGNAQLKAARIKIDPKRVARPLPTIERLDVELTGDRHGVTLSTFTLSVEGQAVRAQGRLPVPDGDWTKLAKEPLAAARRGADLRLEIPDAEVAVFTKFLPEVLAPKGRLQADLHYKSGGLEGFLKLRDAASKPLGPLGVLQEINADIALSGRKLALRGVTARSGGQPINLSGTVELPEKGQPVFDVALRGENLPFVRQTGLLVRGDLDLKMQTPRQGSTRISGRVRLRDSLFLSDVRAFLPKGGASSPMRRPPYFAVETPPMNDWTLAIDLIGEEFMRLRTPVFVGVASARFRLSGTLGEPRAIGEITVDEGRVRMPFASFEVMQGAVRLTEADPYEPAVYVRATGRRWGYDLTMEIDGSATKPNVVFSSSPALDSEQVLLMVMTGAAPSDEISKTGTQRVASIGYFLGQSLLGSLGSDAADADRLSIASGEKISRQGEETYDIEYKLSDRWTVTGEYNEYDEYNVGLKWRVLRGERAGAPKENAKK